MTVKELKELLNNYFDDEKYDDCEIVVPVNGYNMDIVDINHHSYYTKPGGLPYELVIK